MTLFLSVLKIIGITVGTLLAVLLLLLLLVLFVPFRYRAEGVFRDEKRGQARVSWLFRSLVAAVSFDPQAEKTLEIDLRLFGISIPKWMERRRSRKEEKMKRARSRRKEEHKARIREIKNTDPGRYETLRAEAMQKREAREQKEKQAQQERLAKAREDALQAATAEQEGSADRILRLIKRCSSYLLDFFLGICHLPRRLCLAVTSSCSRAASFCDKMKIRVRFFLSRNLRGLLGVLLFRGKKILRHLLPRRCVGDITVGFDDPSKTGMLVALTSAVHPRALRDLTLRPDFVGQKIKGDIAVSGHVRVAYLLWQALQLVIHRYTRAVRRENKQMKKALKEVA